MKLTDDTLRATCRLCGDTHVLKVNDDDVFRWQTGTLIQDAMPYLSADEREILISGTCGKCFDKMFGEDPEGDAQTDYNIEFVEGENPKKIQ